MLRRGLLLVALSVVVASPAAASPITLTFEGIGHNNQVATFYVLQGITFSANAIAQTSTGNPAFQNLPSEETILTQEQGSITIDVLGGFTGGVSVYYAVNTNRSGFQVFSGPNGTGSVLVTSPGFIDNIGGLNTCTAGANPGDPACWTLVSANFAGTGLSIRLPSVDGTLLFDNLTLNLVQDPLQDPSAVPEPASMLLLGSGLVGVARHLRNRGRRQATL
jgi:hypothetical protein